MGEKMNSHHIERLSWSEPAWRYKLVKLAQCFEWGDHGEHEMPGWECVAWKARGGYGSQSDGRGRENAARERIWFSPHCLKPPTLFSQEEMYV